MRSVAAIRQSSGSVSGGGAPLDAAVVFMQPVARIIDESYAYEANIAVIRSRVSKLGMELLRR
jgi:hypothetical protein